jgi:hypothetical protein
MSGKKNIYEHLNDMTMKKKWTSNVKKSFEDGHVPMTMLRVLLVVLLDTRTLGNNQFPDE